MPLASFDQKLKNHTDVLSIRSILPWIGLVLLLISLPHLAAWATTPPDHIFLDAMVNADDISVYLSAIRQGQEGGWLFHYTFSPEEISPILIYFPYLLTGHLLRILNISIMVGYYSLRLIGSTLAMLSFLYWVRVIFPHQRRIQLTAWLLIVFGAGLGWLAIIFIRSPSVTYPDLASPEWSVILTMLSAPHFAFGLAAQVSFFASVVQTMQGKNGRFYVIFPATAALLLGLFYPYNLIVITILLAVYVLARTVQAKRIIWADWVNSMVIAIPVVPLLFYYGVWVQQDVNWKLTHSTGNLIMPPTPLSAVLALGLLAPLAIIGSYYWMKERRDLMPLIWGVGTLVLIYAPVPYSGRFLMGLAVPIGTLAGFGLETAVLPALTRKKIYTIIEKQSRTPYNTIRRIILILTVPSTIMIVLLFSQMGRINPTYPLYLPKADAEASLWFAENSNAEALIMSGYAMGNYLPRVTNSRVFIGQPFLTIDVDTKFAQSSQFWQEDTSLAWREELIETWAITYIYYGVLEKMVANGHDISLPGRLVYEKDGVAIYDVRAVIDDE